MPTYKEHLESYKLHILKLWTAKYAITQNPLYTSQFYASILHVYKMPTFLFCEKSAYIESYIETKMNSVRCY